MGEVCTHPHWEGIVGLGASLWGKSPVYTPGSGPQEDHGCRWHAIWVKKPFHLLCGKTESLFLRTWSQSLLFAHLSSFLGWGWGCLCAQIVKGEPSATTDAHSVPGGSFSTRQLLSSGNGFRTGAVVRTYSGPVTLEALPTQDPV